MGMIELEKNFMYNESSCTRNLIDFHFVKWFLKCFTRSDQVQLRLAEYIEGKLSSFSLKLISRFYWMLPFLREGVQGFITFKWVSWSVTGLHRVKPFPKSGSALIPWSQSMVLCLSCTWKTRNVIFRNNSFV